MNETEHFQQHEFSHARCKCHTASFSNMLCLVHPETPLKMSGHHGQMQFLITQFLMLL